MKARICIGCDHAAVSAKDEIVKELRAADHDVDDMGASSSDPVDYPDVAALVAERVSAGAAERGILLCGTGIGVCIASNKIPGIRAALCHDITTARLSRQHNDANVLCLGARTTGIAVAMDIVRAWLAAEFEAGRHQRRIEKIAALGRRGGGIARAEGADEMTHSLADVDPEVAAAVDGEIRRQQETLELIASENFVSPAVLAAAGTVLTNKYAEGYPGRRYYGGCEFVDIVERLARDRACRLFSAEHANVQPHSGSQANMAVYFTACRPGDTVLGMNLSHGGHLTHGHPLNFSGMMYKMIAYGVRRDTETIDYEEMAALAIEHRPKLIVVGASAYSRVIDFARVREIADTVSARVMADVAHIAGLIAADLHPSPVRTADFVTSTTHKTLRGPRGGLVLCRKDMAKELDKKAFPGIQGGPLMHIIAAKAVCFQEALQPSFKVYQQRILENAKALASSLMKEGFRIVSGGTDNHMFLIDVASAGTTGKAAEEALERAAVTVNKNAIPFDTRPPLDPSGIRIGTPAVTSRGMGTAEMETIGALIARVLKKMSDERALAEVREEVRSLCRRFPLPYQETGAAASAGRVTPA